MAPIAAIPQSYPPADSNTRIKKKVNKTNQKQKQNNVKNKF